MNHSSTATIRLKRTPTDSVASSSSSTHTFDTPFSYLMGHHSATSELPPSCSKAEAECFPASSSLAASARRVSAQSRAHFDGHNDATVNINRTLSSSSSTSVPCRRSQRERTSTSTAAAAANLARIQRIVVSTSSSSSSVSSTSSKMVAVPNATSLPRSPLLLPLSDGVLAKSRTMYCFCGEPADIEDDVDAIYCSVACGRQDALSALCGQEELMATEEVGLGLGMGVASSSSESLHSIGGSHYQRVELAETQRAIDKAKEQGIERTATGVWRYHKSDGARKVSSPSRRVPVPTAHDVPLRLPNPDLFPSTYITLPRTPTATSVAARVSSRPLPPLPLVQMSAARSKPMARGASHAPSTSTSTTGSMVPSLSNSSTPSYASSRTYSSSSSSARYSSSPLSPRFPFSTPTNDKPSHHSPLAFDQQRDTVPALNDIYGNSDIYAEYLLPTPPSLAAEFESPSRFSHRFGPIQGEGGERDTDAGEERDKVQHTLEFGAHDMRVMTRQRSDASRNRRLGHQKGKLSFDDVVGIMQAQ